MNKDQKAAVKLIEVDHPHLPTREEEEIIENFFVLNPQLKTEYIGKENFNPDDPWIQTYTGVRFTPLNPVVESIKIEDIAHSLSMQCRFGGHLKYFYSVAQHSVLVSYICDQADALWGLCHDFSEAYLMDFPTPLKHSGKFDEYKVFEARMMKAICRRFNLSEQEPVSVTNADKLLLVTEKRDLFLTERSDWNRKITPLPFKIEPWSPEYAEQMLLERFDQLTGSK